jgi:putative phosphotransacetylase
MNELEIKKTVEQVLARYAAEKAAPCATPACAKDDAGTGGIMLEVSARHVHLTKDAMSVLFGQGAALTEKRALSQPGEFLSEERVKLVTAKGVIDNVAVLGPERSAVQCELSMTDCRTLGINAPVNLSGDLSGAGSVIIVGPCGVVDAKNCVIVARAHIHLTPADASRLGVSNGQHVRVAVDSKRPVTFDDVIIRVKDSFAQAMHIDFDEANACAYDKSASARIVR